MRDQWLIPVPSGSESHKEMKIAADTRLMIEGRMDGIGRYTYETFRRIVREHPEHEFLFLFDRPWSDKFIFAGNVVPVRVFPPGRHALLWHIRTEVALPAILKRNRADCYVGTDGFVPPCKGIPSVAVIHDINFYHRPRDLPFFSRLYYRKRFPVFAGRSDRIVTVSGYSKKDLVSAYGIPPEKIDVAYNAAGGAFHPLSPDAIRKTKNRLAGGSDYFIFVGSLIPRKNINRLLAAFDIFRQRGGENFKLVIAGGNAFKKQGIGRAYRRMKHKKDVVFTGRLSGNDLVKALGAAYAMVFVPMIEGFGIPVLEAMKCGIPVICSDTTSLPEVAGDAAMYVNPYDEDSIALAMHEISINKVLRDLLIRKGNGRWKNFSWENAAEVLWNAILKTTAMKSI